MTLKLHYYADDNTAYLNISAEIAAESEEVSPGIVLDYGADGHVVGIEFLNARAHLPPDALVAAE